MVTFSSFHTFYMKNNPIFKMDFLIISKNISWYQKLFLDIKKSNIKKSNFWYQKIEFLVTKNRILGNK